MALKSKTEKWLLKNCDFPFIGMTVLITGANSGIGFKSAEIMLYLGAKVIMACRDAEKANIAANKLLRDHPGADIDIMTLDLADFSSIDAFADTLKEKHIDVDVFLNNAGVFRKPGMKTKDGFELVIGTNYLGVYRLCEAVLPYLETLPHEVTLINTVSIIHKIAKIDYGDFFHDKKYNDFAVYAASKLCLAKYTYYKARQYENGNVRIVMSHPGISITPLGVNAFGSAVGKAAKAVSRVFNSPEKSALSLPYIIARRLPGGTMAGPGKLAGGWGYPKQNRILKKVKTGGEQLIIFTDELLNRS